MLFTYNDCIKEYGSDYQLKKALSDQKLYKVEKGIFLTRYLLMKVPIINIFLFMSILLNNTVNNNYAMRGTYSKMKS